jgi:hypothetical protein
MNLITPSKSEPIPIQNNSYSKELTLNNIYVDPNKMSPPNIFIDKLKKRIDYYYSPDNKNKNNNKNKLFYTIEDLKPHV